MKLHTDAERMDGPSWVGRRGSWDLVAKGDGCREGAVHRSSASGALSVLALIAALAALAIPARAFAADEPSLFDVDTQFTDQLGRTGTLKSLSDGHPTLVTMFYGSCHFACPMLTSRIHRIEAQLPEDVRRNVRVVFVTFDPKRDTVDSLRKLHQAQGLDATRWSFLRTDDEDAIAELAAVLNIKYRFARDGSINHSSVVTLIDARGVVHGRLEGFDAPDENLLAPLRQLSAR